MTRTAIRLALSSCCACAAVALAQQAPPQPAVSPAQGQNAAQQQADKSACLSLANTNAPSQPVAPPAPVAPTVTGPRPGATVRGAPGNAAAGTQRATANAAAGAVPGGIRAREANRQQNAAAARTRAYNAANANQVYGNCMQGKGYDVH